MSWLQVGVAKSGNMWLYRILQSIRVEAGLPRTNFITTTKLYEAYKDRPLSFPGQAEIDSLSIHDKYGLQYRISKYNEKIDDIDDYVLQTSHVWCQNAFCKTSKRVYPKFSKIVYVLRDPRDCAISMSKFSFTPYRQEHFAHGLQNPEAFLDHQLPDTIYSWARHVAGHLAHYREFGIHVVFYERLLSDFDAELGKMLDYLNVRLSPEQRERVKNGVHFSAMKGDSPQHVREGKAGGWKNVLSDVQTAAVARIAGPLMRKLGYPEGKNEAAGLPAIPEPYRPGDYRSLARRAWVRHQIERKSRAIRKLLVR